MRIGLGCMRLSTELERDDALAVATLRAALDAGITVFDTARAYGRDESDLGHNERLVARVRPPRIVTKCGMRRDGGAWIPDGRASRIAEDVAASVEALGGAPIDTLLLHAPDPRTSLATSARALTKAVENGQAARIGISNVSRKQLEEVAQHAPIAAVEIALGAYDDLSLRGGVVDYCLSHEIEVLAHAPLGGPARVRRLARDGTLARVAKGRGDTTAVEVFLAYLLAVNDRIVPIVGARRPETIASFVRASALVLSEEELAIVDQRFPVLAALRRPARTPSPSAPEGRAPCAPHREVVMLMGVPGAGKSRAAEDFVARGYERLNRDALGGTLRGIVRRLDERLRAGAERIVLDNTYVTRATRNDVVRIAHTHGASVRCVFFDTPPHEAHVNVVLRIMRRFGSVLEPAELVARSRKDPVALVPSAVYRMTRDLEPPSADEGFASVDVVPFVREHGAERGRPGLAISLDTPESEIARAIGAAPPDAACLLYGWRPGIDDGARARARATADALARATARVVELALCTHPAGPPVCWCRPPLPGMWLTFADRHGVDVRDSALVGTSSTDRSLARTLGLRFTGA
ncbi:MAG: oxidoreductase [Labilithrix sp.]|nr:oxidoreductase [Labilithrix sp.]